MSKNKQDLRVTKTHQGLQNAMRELLEKKPFEKITVNDLCKKALISRTAFYAHFEDKYDLLRFCLDQVKEQLSQSARKKGKKTLFPELADHIYANPAVYKHLVMDEGHTELRYMLDDLFIDVLTAKIEEVDEREKTENQVPADILAVFCSGGLTNLLIWLLRNNFPIEKETMLQYLLEMYHLIQQQ